MCKSQKAIKNIEHIIVEEHIVYSIFRFFENFLSVFYLVECKSNFLGEGLLLVWSETFSGLYSTECKQSSISLPWKTATSSPLTSLISMCQRGGEQLETKHWDISYRLCCHSNLLSNEDVRPRVTPTVSFFCLSSPLLGETHMTYNLLPGQAVWSWFWAHRVCPQGL
jgi:hypothetical protein